MTSTWSLFIIYINISFTVYADDIFHNVYDFHIQRWDEENLTNLAETLKIVGPPMAHATQFFQLQGTFALGGAAKYRVG